MFLRNVDIYLQAPTVTTNTNTDDLVNHCTITVCQGDDDDGDEKPRLVCNCITLRCYFICIYVELVYRRDEVVLIDEGLIV
jgi:hypothetical protein